ncbi:Nuclear control of ATPase protein 2 [Yarrowia sp. B02]|nr:Nuclear control of ATPase protein 2 [Yarrowia sp. B02]
MLSITRTTLAEFSALAVAQQPPLAQDVDEKNSYIATLARLARTVAPPQASHDRLVSVDLITQTMDEFLRVRAKDGTGADSEDSEFLLLTFAALSMYGNVVDTLVDQTVPISQDLYYWQDVHDSWYRLAMLLVQTGPIRVFSLARDIYRRYDSVGRIWDRLKLTAKKLFEVVKTGGGVLVASSLHDETSLRFRTSVFMSKPPLSFATSLLLSPIAAVRRRARQNHTQLAHIKNSHAADLGRLATTLFTTTNTGPASFLDEGVPKITTTGGQDWKESVVKSIDAMTQTLGAGTGEETKALDVVSSDKDISGLAHEIIQLSKLLSLHSQQHKEEIDKYGKPSYWVRMWPTYIFGSVAASFALLSFLHNWQNIVDWFRTSVVSTIQLFFQNWIVSPIKQIIHTIRHDNSSQIAVISKRALQADMDSLERMVVQFAVQNDAPPPPGSTWTAEDIQHVKQGVQQGDITPVLKSYEKEIMTPVKSLIGGSLITSLLIQVQKTKVDVEVAISGIDQILKSQELVFGIIAALPSFSVTWWVFQWFTGTVLGRRRASLGLKRQNAKDIATETLGRIDRVLSLPCTDVEEINTKVGLILCDTHLLRSIGPSLVGKRVREWNRDLDDIDYGCREGELARDTVRRMWFVYQRFLR